MPLIHKIKLFVCFVCLKTVTREDWTGYPTTNSHSIENKRKYCDPVIIMSLITQHNIMVFLIRSSIDKYDHENMSTFKIICKWYLEIQFRFMVFNATFNNISVISWRSVLLMEETGKNHRPAAICHWQTLSQCCIE